MKVWEQCVPDSEWGHQSLCPGHAKFEVSIRHPKRDVKSRVGYIWLCASVGYIWLSASVRTGVVNE